MAELPTPFYIQTIYQQPVDLQKTMLVKINVLCHHIQFLIILITPSFPSVPEFPLYGLIQKSLSSVELGKQELYNVVLQG